MSDKIESFKAEWMLEQGCRWNSIMRAAESPIEELFLATILMHGEWDLGSGCPWHGLTTAEMRGISPGGRLLEGVCAVPIVVQAKVSANGRNYRIDFAFIFSDTVRIAVELDGHDFHERTKAQAKRDKSKNRNLTSAGWRVMRFTGSEVYEDPFDVLDQVLECGNGLLVNVVAEK